MSEEVSEDEYEDSISDISLIEFEEKTLTPTQQTKHSSKMSHLEDTNNTTDTVTKMGAVAATRITKRNEQTLQDKTERQV